MSKKFTQLHLHTHIGSQLDGVGDPYDYAKKAKEYGHTALACTDHGKMNALFEHQKACLQEGIKPIFGVEAYFAPELEVYETKNKRKKRVRTKNWHLLLLAKNKIGYKNILHLNYLSNKDTEHFYYSNRLLLEELIEHKEGIMVGSGCLASPITSLFRNGQDNEAIEMFDYLVTNLRDNFFVEIQLNELTNEMDGLQEGQKTANNLLIDLAEHHGVPVVITGDVHYLDEGQHYLQTLAIAIRNGDKMSELKFELESKFLHYHSIADYAKFNLDFGYNYSKEQLSTWLSNTQIIADQCNYLMPERKIMHLPGNLYEDKSVLVTKSIEGLCKYFNVDDIKQVPEEYEKRLYHELSILVKKGMSSYVMILKDIFDFVKKEKIMRGPSRGSGGGSLVLFSLGITTLDPIKYDLLFERFLSEQRSPDVVFDWFGELND